MKCLFQKLRQVIDAAKLRRNYFTLLRSDLATTSNDVPEGHVPVYVGQEMERFVVNAEVLNHPVFVTLLNMSAQEYGYNGVLRIPCRVVVFEQILEAIRLGRNSGAIHELISEMTEFV